MILVNMRHLLHIFVIIACHWTMAIFLVFANKQLLSSGHNGQDLSVFIAWIQCAVAFLALAMIFCTSYYVEPTVPWTYISPATFLRSDVLAMSFTFVGVVLLNNLMLKHIGIAFYQVARSSTLLFSVFFSWLFLGVSITLSVTCSCLTIIVGFFISVNEETSLGQVTFLGVIYGILASICAALSGIYIKRVDKIVNGDCLTIALLNNLNSVVILLPLVFGTGQFGTVWRSEQFQDARLWLMLIVTGLLSFLVGWASNKVISLTSPVTHHVSINAKSLVQTLLAVFLHQETKTWLWWLGNLLVMLGILSYAWITTSHLPEMQIEVAASNSKHEISENNFLLGKAKKSEDMSV